MWYVSATLLLYNMSFMVLKRELKVAPDTKIGIYYEKLFHQTINGVFAFYGCYYYFKLHQNG